MTDASEARRVPAIPFKQWLPEWDAYDFNVAAHRRKPNPHAYVFSMKAAELRRLCDVYKRERTDEGAEGIQRYRDDQRTARIQQYVHFGYPYGDLPERRRTAATDNLRKPGWLPTAIVINILVEDDKRRGRSVDPRHLVTIGNAQNGVCELTVPAMPKVFVDTLAPMEVIDGQHRLWAFDPIEGGDAIPEDFELPVVAFHGLDIAWQAYLFWSINVSPKKINPSHAFDLYPLLRTEDWLEEVGEITVYREARAQELTAILYDHPSSVWRARINMLGEKGGPGVSQAAWVRGLLSTFFATGRGSGRYGLFQSNLRGTDEPLDWSRAQQAAFLAMLWSDIGASIQRSAHQHWWIRCYESDATAALTDRTSMLNQDMGIRAILSVANDLFFRRAREWGLDQWDTVATGSSDAEDVSAALDSLSNTRFRPQISSFAEGLVRFDWRSFDGPRVNPDEGRTKRAYRGSGGYTVLAEDILREVSDGQDPVATTAAILLAKQV